MIKYLDKIPFPDSYKILGNGVKKFNSIEDFVSYSRYRSQSRYGKRKYKRSYPYVRIINNSIRINLDKYYSDNIELSDNDIDIIISNSDYMDIYFSRDFTKIIFVHFWHGLDDSFLDPDLYYGGIRLDPYIPYSTDFAPSVNTPCVIWNEPYTIKFHKHQSHQFVLSYTLYNYIYRKNEFGYSLYFHDICNKTTMGCAPIHSIKKYTNKRNDNKYHRYRVSYKELYNDKIYESIMYLDAENIDDAKNAFYNDYRSESCTEFSIIQIQDGEWF